MTIGITLVFDTPPSIAAAGASGARADRSVVRDAKEEFIIPGSHVKGKLRHVCEQLLRALGEHICESPRAETMCPNPPGGAPPCLACQIFGSASRRSPLRFQDLVWEAGLEGQREPFPASLRAMTAINRRRRTVETGRLFLVETSPYVARLQFANKQAILGRLDNEAQVKLLLAGLRLISAWGGMKSRGLGWSSLKDLRVSAKFDDKRVEPGNWKELKTLCSGTR